LPDADITLGGGVDGVDSDYTSGTAVKIDSSGNVGIGTSSPTAELHIKGAQPADAFDSQLLVDTTDTTGTINYGSKILFGYHDGVNGRTGPYILGAKENSTSGNYASYMSFATRPNGGSPTERMRIDSSGNLKFNSGYGSAATAYGCRAWVNFNGTGTPSIRGSGNVSSISDNGTGLYTVNFSTALPDGNYAVTGSTVGDTPYWADHFLGQGSAPTTTGVGIRIWQPNTHHDSPYVHVAIFR